jgi:hypothetical protein
MMTDYEDEAVWRAEFDRLGEDQVTALLENKMVPEPKRQVGFRWLSERATARRNREGRTFNYVRWTFFAAIAAVIVGVIGILVTIVGIWATLSAGD